MMADILCRPAKNDSMEYCGTRPDVVRQCKINIVEPGAIIMVWCNESARQVDYIADSTSGKYYKDAGVYATAVSDYEAVRTSNIITGFISFIGGSIPGSSLEYCIEENGDFPDGVTTEDWNWQTYNLQTYKDSYNALKAKLGGTPKSVYLLVDSSPSMYVQLFPAIHFLAWNNVYEDFVDWLEDEEGVETVNYDNAWVFPNASNLPYTFQGEDWLDQVTAAINLFNT